jgi:SAM-dependent methyltransferase
MSLGIIIKWILFPGFNLHARQRYAVIPEHFSVNGANADSKVLDAGCGNGMLSYKSYLGGNRVVGVTIKEGECRRCRDLFNAYLAVPEDRLRFEVLNLHEVDRLKSQFDEIICSEVLEHIEDDSAICREFAAILKPGGFLHLCCPNAEHPDNIHHAIDEDESGGHVRAGYTFESYRTLLEPLGFELTESDRLGGTIRQFFNKRIIAHGIRYGRIAEAFWFALSLPFVWLDRFVPFIPYSIYVKAVKKDT